MVQRVQIVGHTTAEADLFIGLVRELTVDFTKRTIRVHDGATPGGFETVLRNLSNVLAVDARVNLGLGTAALRNIGAVVDDQVLDRLLGDARWAQIAAENTFLSNQIFNANVECRASVTIDGELIVLGGMDGAIITNLNASELTHGIAAVGVGGTGAIDAANAQINLDVPPNQRLINTTNGIQGGGNLSADRTLSLVVASKAEAEAGTDNIKAMTALRVKEAIDVLAQYGFVPPGVMIDFMGTAIPAPWDAQYLLCDGANVSRSTYARLFNAIGTAWGVGDGSTTFGLPDSRRRVSIGAGGTAVSGPANSVGSVGGEEAHTMIIAELAAHNHPGSTHPVSGTDGLGTSKVGSSQTSSAPVTVASEGSSTPFNVMQPSLVVTKLIKI